MVVEEFPLENVLESKLDVKAVRFGANCEALRVLLAALRVEEDEIRLGGGPKAAEAQRAKGRLTVRERLKLLLDEGRSSWNWAFGRRVGCMRSMAGLRRPGW